MSKVFNNVKRFCAKSQLFAFCGKLWYNIYRKYERDMNRKEVNRMKIEMKINIDKEIDNHRCPGVYFCTVATTCYEEWKREHKCYLFLEFYYHFL